MPELPEGRRNRKDQGNQRSRSARPARAKEQKEPENPAPGSCPGPQPWDAAAAKRPDCSNRSDCVNCVSYSERPERPDCLTHQDCPTVPYATLPAVPAAAPGPRSGAPGAAPRSERGRWSASRAMSPTGAVPARPADPSRAGPRELRPRLPRHRPRRPAGTAWARRGPRRLPCGGRQGIPDQPGRSAVEDGVRERPHEGGVLPRGQGAREVGGRDHLPRHGYRRALDRRQTGPSAPGARGRTGSRRTGSRSVGTGAGSLRGRYGTGCRAVPVLAPAAEPVEDAHYRSAAPRVTSVAICSA